MITLTAVLSPNDKQTQTGRVFLPNFREYAHNLSKKSDRVIKKFEKSRSHFLSDVVEN